MVGVSLGVALLLLLLLLPCLAEQTLAFPG
jgi:hypothetical protein